MMNLEDYCIDAEARAFAAYAESNPRLKELAELQSDGLLTDEEEWEFFLLLDKADMEFFGPDPFMNPEEYGAEDCFDPSYP